MICLTFTTVAGSESFAQHYAVGFKSQPGALGARIKPPDQHIKHWRVQTFQVDEPKLNDEELRCIGMRRVEVNQEELK